jgi:broad specificity phosphatase PhoE
MSTGERRLWSDRDPPANACRLLLVRHATAAGNGRFLGQRDVALTGKGRRELPALCRKCSRFPVRAVYSSDLRRAREAAEFIARKFGLEVEVRPELREIHFGEWEGLTWNQIAQRHPRLAARWMERFPLQPIPGGEPLRQFRRRIAAAVSDIVAANRGQCALVVTHAGVIRFTLAKALGLPARNIFRLAQDPGAINIIDYVQGSAIVRCVNG